MNKFQNLKATVVLAMAPSMIFLTLYPVSFMVGETYKAVNQYVVNHPADVHDVSDPEDRAFADRVRAAAPLQAWVMDSTIIDQSKFSCAIYDKVPDMTMEKHFELHRDIMFGADQAFQYMSYEGVKINCPQYLDKYPADFNYKVVKEYKTETVEG